MPRVCPGGGGMLKLRFDWYIRVVRWLAGWLAGWLVGKLAGWLAGWWLAVWLVGRLVDWLAVWLVGWLVNWLPVRLVSWLAGCLAGWLFSDILQLKLGNIWEYSPIFKTARVAKNIWRIMNAIAFIWLKRCARIFLFEHYLFPKAHSLIFLSENCSFLGTDNVRGQIPELIFAPNEIIVYRFSWQMEAIVFVIVQINFRNTRSFEHWRIFSHLTRLDQSRASESIWWIIMNKSINKFRLKLLKFS